MNMAEQSPVAGEPLVLEPGLRRILAPNPSPMALHGTNTYFLGEGDVAIIDPGPAMPEHLGAIQHALNKGERFTHILVTHAHLDHSGLAPLLAEQTGAPVLARGNAFAGRSETMRALARQGLSGGGEGLDNGFRADVLLADGEIVGGNDWTLQVLHTPGHAANHVSFRWGDTVFTGDTVMGWASTLVSPPDGDLSAFMRSVERIKALDSRVFYPGHGSPITETNARCEWLLAHRRQREEEILLELSNGSATVAALTAAIYVDTPPALLPAAERNVFAHLIDLVERKQAHAHPSLSISARFHRV
ncbi:MBL fold metallo-hydrolase [Pseudoruegeria sp. HB172150]|uniref:MBL fold metallo-hydrolase n=1 Tax=Pseudoruegeria sp. HB172150 TaxID=2721164 RepID=UPI0015519D6D|nr:MBL fold metallo-hydrolase [Pseudoruegeria sp. HB172150]